LSQRLRAAATGPRMAEMRTLVAFLAVGGLNTLVGYGLFAIFVLVGLSLTVALTFATILGVLFNFQSIGRLVFRSDHRGRLPRFIIVYAVQFGINLGLLHALHAAGLSPLLSQLAILPPLAIASFLAMRRFVFRTNPSPPP
jgi:putative flippase GtrA